METADKKTSDGVVEFELSLDVIPVRLINPQTKQSEDYELWELSGVERDEYMNVMTRKVEVSAGAETARVKNFVGLQSALLCRSLRRKGDKECVREDVIQSFPSKTRDALFKMANELSGLEQEDSDEGND